MPTQTSNYGLSKPLVNNVADQDLWGNELNDDLDDIDTLTKYSLQFVPSTKTTSFSVTAPTSGSVDTGDSKKLFLCNATSGTITASLPAASGCSGMTIAFKKTDASVNTVVIDGDGSETIDGATTFTLSSQYAWAVIACDGTNWHIISQYAVPQAFVPYSYVAGCLISGITGTNTTASFSVSSGQVANSANSAIVISAGYSWAASNGNAINGTDAASSTLANSTTYHVYVCSGNTGTGTFVSATYPGSGVTFPTGYTTSYRRIGSFRTDSSGSPIPYTSIETEGGSTINWLTTQLLDASGLSVGTGSRTAVSLSVPTGIKVAPFYRAQISPFDSAARSAIFTSGDETDVAAGAYNWTTVPGADGAEGTSVIAGYSFPRDGVITTNTSGQIYVRYATNSGTLYLTTRGWKDWRRS